jgi:putative FmdB family regulatory protein
MPIYEFFCNDCNTIFNFFSNSVNTEKRPMCPKCNEGPLDKVISNFAVFKGEKKQVDMEMPELDEAKLQKAMSMLEREAENINEDDPRQAACLMRKLCNTTGLNIGSGIDEALRRMEAGEDPDKTDEAMGDLINDKDLLKISPKTNQRFKKKPSELDETLYFL